MGPILSIFITVYSSFRRLSNCTVNCHLFSHLTIFSQAAASVEFCDNNVWRSSPPFPSLPFLPFPSLPVTSLPFPSLPFPSLPFPSLPFHSFPFRVCTQAIPPQLDDCNYECLPDMDYQTLRSTLLLALTFGKPNRIYFFVFLRKHKWTGN